MASIKFGSFARIFFLISSGRRLTLTFLISPHVYRIFAVALLILLFSTDVSIAAPTTYFSRASTDWNTNGTWSTVGFASATNTGTHPIAGDFVIIGGGFNVTIGAAAAACATLTINDASTLTIGGFTITVSGATIVGGGTSGTVNTITSATGTKTFTGLVTINPGGIWDLSTRNPATSFGGGIIMNGATFNNGTGATAFSASQSLAGSGNMTFGGAITAVGTLTNNNSGTVTLASTINGNLTQGISAPTPTLVFSFTGTPYTAGTLDASTNANTVNYTGAAQTIKPTTYKTLGLSGSGAKTMTGVTTIGTDFNMSGSCTATPVITTVGGDINITGTAIMTTGANNNVTGGLTVGTGATLRMGGFSLQIGSTTSVTGTVNTITASTGTKTFTGPVTINVGGSWDLSGQNPATSFAGGISAGGTTFNNGSGATAFTATQNLAGSSNMTFGGVISITGTLTNNNTGTVTCANTITGNLTQGPGSTLTLSFVGTPIGAGTFDASANANIVTYSGAGAQTVKAVAYRTLNLSTSGAKTMTGVTTIGTDLNISGSATAATVITSVGGNVTLSGTAQMTNGANNNVTGSLTVGTGTTLRLDGFSFSVGGATSVTGTLNTVTAGTGTKTFTGLVTINAGGVWDLSSLDPNTSFGGGITMNGTTFDNGAGSAAFSATQSLSGTGNMTFGGSVTPAGGTTLTNASTGTVTIASVTLTGNFTQGAGSTLSLTGIGPFTGAGTLNASANANTVNYSGAAQTVQPVSYRTLTLSGSGVKTMTGVSTVANDFTISGTADVTASTALTIGGNITLGAGTAFTTGAFTHNIAGNWSNNGSTITSTGSTINFNGTAQSIGGSNSTGFNNVSLSGTTSVTATIATDFGGNFTLGSGTTFTAGAFTHTVGGNWINNGGTLVGAGSTITLDGGTQSIGGTSSTTFNNLNLSGAGTTTLSRATTISGNFGIGDGTVANLGGFTTHTANTLTLGGRGESAGTWGGTGSGATNISSDYFTAASGRITISVSTGGTLPYVETFAGETNGSTSNASPAWSVTTDPGGTFEKNQSGTVFLQTEAVDAFVINNTGATEGVWQTADLDIGASFTDVYISAELIAYNTSASDYLNLYYVWDAGGTASEILIQSVTTTGGAPGIQLPVAGHSKIRLVARAKETNAGSNLFGLLPFEYAIANIDIEGIRTLYSRATAPWASSGTWSLVAIGGTDCACTPAVGGTDKVFIGGGNTVTLGAAGVAAAVTVNGTADVGGAGTLALSTFEVAVDLAGAFTVNNGGTVTSGGAGSAITFSDGRSHTMTNNGTITTANFNVTQTSSNATMAVTINGLATSTLSITTAATFTNNSFFGTALIPMTLTTNVPMSFGAAATAVTDNNGTFVNNSTVTMTNTAAGVINGGGTWQQGANSILNYAGSTITATLDATGSLNTVDYNAAGAQTIRATTYVNLNLSTSGAKSAGGNITVRGNWNRSGTATFTPGANTVTFAALVSTAAQTITAVGGETFNSLTINSAFATSPQITLANNVTVSSVMTMTAGNIDLNSKVLTISSNATGALSHSLASTAGWAYGGSIVRAFPATAIAIGVADGFLPIGTSTNFRPFFLAKTNLANSNGTITLTHSDPGTTTSTGLNIVDTSPAGTIIIRNNAVWSSTVTNSGAAATFRVRYGGTGLGTVSSLTHLRSMLFNSVIATNVAATGSLTDPRVERLALTFAQATNNFYVGSTDVTSPLPITLISFTGTAKKYGVELDWKTATETNNDYFTVLHSPTGKNFEPVGTADGSGTTNQEHSYALTHYKPVVGRNYYQLRQTDFDGQSVTSEAIVVNVLSLEPLIAVYPNPISENQALNVVINGLPVNRAMEFQILNMRGITMNGSKVVTDGDGTLKTSVSLNGISPGMYVLKIQNVHLKFIIE
jgi:hypothetical protein